MKNQKVIIEVYIIYCFIKIVENKQGQRYIEVKFAHGGKTTYRIFKISFL